MGIVFFDGYCSLCNSFIDFLMRVDRRHALKYASLQGETARQVLGNLAAGVADPDSVIYYREGKIFERSTAVLEIFRDLGGAWKMLVIFFVLPKIVRDSVYKIVARHRYQLFGRRETCRLPTAEEKNKLLP